MAGYEQVVQQFLDAVADKHVFCRGEILTLTFDETGPTGKPNCGVIDECPLFRNPSWPGPRKLFDPGLGGHPEDGCDAFVQLRRWQQSKQHWIVQFAGRPPQEVQAGSALGAACKAWWDSLQTGQPIDKMLLLEKRYTVREA